VPGGHDDVAAAHRQEAELGELENAEADGDVITVRFTPWRAAARRSAKRLDRTSP